MDADEKLAALKKAYADIILSITKETAARVLASERKSAMFQHELKEAKEEGVRMLVRLKQMMDRQTGEAEAASLIQRKKIEELEAQLQEAEEIVKDLREELEDVQAKLERVKSENFNHLNELENKLSSYQSSEALPPDEASDVMVPDLSQRNACLNCYNKTVCSCDVFTGNQDSPSIMVVEKDPGLYRNGWIQRIHARQLEFVTESDDASDKKNGGELKEGKQNPEEPALVAKIQTELEKKLLADINFGTSKSFSRKRKRASRQKRAETLMGGKKDDQLPEHSVTSGPVLVNGKAQSTENPSKIGPQLSGYKVEPQSQLQSAENVRNVVEIDGANEGEKEKMVPFRRVTESSESFSSLKDVEKVDVAPPESKLSGATKALTSQTVTFLEGREIKYTYQRKRKRQALSQSEVSVSLETGKKTGDGKNSDQKIEQPKVIRSCEKVKKTGDGQNGVQKVEQPKVIRSCEKVKKTGDGQKGVQKVEQPESGWLEGSLREHKRMVQVARQLLSLSDEKLWR